MQSTPIEAVRLESGICSYNTHSKRNILIASKRALRCDKDHPSRLAFDSEITHRLKRQSLKTSAKKLAVHLPQGAENRLQINNNTYPSWGSKKEVTILPNLPGEVDKSSEMELLRSTAMSVISNTDAELTIYTDGSAKSGTQEGGSAFCSDCN